MKFLLLPVKIGVVPSASIMSQGQNRFWSVTETVPSEAMISLLLDDNYYILFKYLFAYR